jgi:hypothetical protein
MRPLPSSFRDNDGFVFEHQDTVFRYIHPRYLPHFEQLSNSGLFSDLVKKQWLINHTEIGNIAQFGFEDGIVILPEQISFISYPYEWSFNMWQDAAMLTLKIALVALKQKMVLKDATPFNIQFAKGKPVFIDTISFENYEAGKPWVAYHQFCECFLAPLLLMHYSNHDCYKFFAIYPNGIPLNVLVTLLPKKAKWNLNIYLHIYLHSKLSSGKKNKKSGNHYFSQQKFELLLKALSGLVQKLSLRKAKTEWDDYYTDTILGDDYLLAKNKLVQSFLATIDFKTVTDLGANDGYFSLLFKNTEKQIVAIDGDVNCINELYLKVRNEKINNILPLVNVLHTPSPAIGWNNVERTAITKRIKSDLVMALALVHHLAIANNLPLQLIADWLLPMGRYLLIEFVPKTDEKVKLLLENREDIFINYSIENFEAVFLKKYEILLQEKIQGTDRILYLMKRLNETT